MVDFTPEQPKKQIATFSFTPKKKSAVPRDLRQKVVDLRAVLLACLTTERLWIIAEQIIELAEAGNLEAATWIVDRCIGKPTQAIDISQSELPSNEAPKVVLLDWRSQPDAAPESN